MSAPTPTSVVSGAAAIVVPIEGQSPSKAVGWNPLPALSTEAAAPPTASLLPRRPSLLSDALAAKLREASAKSLSPWMLEFQRSLATPPLASLPKDPCSNARPDEAVTTHLAWEVAPDFQKKELHAVATYTFRNIKDGNRELHLDAAPNLQIDYVTVDGQSVEFKRSKSENSNRPDALMIPLSIGSKSGEVKIKYHTIEPSTGLFWVAPQHTEGKNHPLLFTLFECTEGASVIPGQHCPQVRMTYEVHVKTGSPDLMALSSVPNNPTLRTPTGEYERLKMDRAVPLYLLSLHVGNFVYHPYDERTGVYAEEAAIREAVQAFGVVPLFMKTAEEILGPYNWRVYRPILLGRAFPYMAMEHPCASSCGSVCKERPSVIPHELAHSWAGNDITNACWQQFFWNEGLTTFVEYLIMEKIFGSDYAVMELMNIVAEAKAAMDKSKESNPDQLRLCQEGAFDFSRIPYGKGALFFFMLRNAMGKDHFDRFLKDYMKVFFQNTMSDLRFMFFLEKWLRQERGVSDFVKFCNEHHLEEWLYGTKMPPNEPKFRSALLDKLHQEKEKVLREELIDLEASLKWDVTTTVNFLSLLTTTTPGQLAKLDAQMRYSQNPSLSIRGEWVRACCQAGYFTKETEEMICAYVFERNSAFEAGILADFLAQSEAGRALVIRILAEGGDRLFPVTRQKFERVQK